MFLCCDTRFHAPSQVLNYHSCVFFFFLSFSLFLFFPLLANGFARLAHTFGVCLLEGEKRQEPWEKDDLQSLFDIICYFNHTQLQTEITSQRQTEAQITF